MELLVLSSEVLPPSDHPCSRAEWLLLHHSHPLPGSVPPALPSDAPALPPRASPAAGHRGGDRAPLFSTSPQRGFELRSLLCMLRSPLSASSQAGTWRLDFCPLQWYGIEIQGNNCVRNVCIFKAYIKKEGHSKGLVGRMGSAFCWCSVHTCGPVCPCPPPPYSSFS